MNAKKHIEDVHRAIIKSSNRNFANVTSGTNGTFGKVMNSLLSKTITAGTSINVPSGEYSIIIDKKSRTAYTSAKVDIEGFEYTLLVQSSFIGEGTKMKHNVVYRK